MQITTIIPTYKRPQLLKRAVLSVLAQQFTDFEILIADNASGEQTAIVIEELQRLDSRIKWLRQPSNIGMPANFSSALAKVTTPYVSFLCDDDFLAPHFFDEVLPFFTKYPEIAFCGGGGVAIDANYTIKIHSPWPPSGYYAPPKGLFEYIHSSFGIVFTSLIFKTEALREFGGVDKRIRNGMDEHLISQCAARHPVYLITDKCFSFGSQHEEKLSGQIDYPLFEKEALYLQQNILSVNLAEKEKTQLYQFFKKRRLKILSNAVKHFSRSNNFKQASIYAAKIVKIDSSLRWRRKQIEVNFYRLFPWAYFLMKKHKKQVLSPISESALPPNIEQLREYAMQLNEQSQDVELGSQISLPTL